jgi:hypothetical protein
MFEGMVGVAQAIKNAQSHTQDPSAIDAMTVLDTQSNLGAVSAQKAQDATVDAAKAPSPEIHVKIVDGKAVIDAKNLPAKSPLDQIKEAQASPFMEFGKTLQAKFGGGGAPAATSPEAAPQPDVATRLNAGSAPSKGAASSLQEALRQRAQRALDEHEKMRTALPDPNGADIDEKLKTRAGREALAREVGLNEPEFRKQGGILAGLGDALSRGGDYRAAINDPASLRTAVMLHRQQQLSTHDREGNASVQQLLQTAGMAKNQEDADGPSGDEIKLLDTLVHRDPLGYKTPDEHVAAVEGVLRRKLNDGEKGMLYAAHSDALHDRELEASKEEMKKADEARKEAKDAEQKREADRRFYAAQENTNRLIAASQGKTLDDSTADYVIQQRKEGANIPLSGNAEIALLKRMKATGENAPIALTAQSGQALAKLDEVDTETESLRSVLAKHKASPYWNMPFDKLPQAVKYSLGMGTEDEIGKLQSAFSIEKYAGTMQLIPGIRRGDIIEKASQHLPDFGHDSLKLMYDKLSNAHNFYSQNKASITKFGTKSGVAQGGGAAANDDPLGIRQFLPKKK